MLDPHQEPDRNDEPVIPRTGVLLAEAARWTSWMEQHGGGLMRRLERAADGDPSVHRGQLHDDLCLAAWTGRGLDVNRQLLDALGQGARNLHSALHGCMAVAVHPPVDLPVVVVRLGRDSFYEQGKDREIGTLNSLLSTLPVVAMRVPYGIKGDVTAVICSSSLEQNHPGVPVIFPFAEIEARVATSSDWTVVRRSYAAT